MTSLEGRGAVQGEAQVHTDVAVVGPVMQRSMVPLHFKPLGT